LPGFPIIWKHSGFWSSCNLPCIRVGTVNPYAADYVGFTNLGDTYDIFVFIPQNLSESATASYSYTGRLGSFLLSVGGLSDTTVAASVKEGSSGPTPAVVRPFPRRIPFPQAAAGKQRRR